MQTQHVARSESAACSPADRRMQQAAHSALIATGYPALAALECCVEEGSIRLSGTVPRYYLKQLAQSVVLRLAAGQTVDNRISVS